VELPSQIMENWMREPEVLALFARHYQSGEKIPQESIDKIRKSATFNQGFATVEYVAAAYLDLEHSTRVSRRSSTLLPPTLTWLTTRWIRQKRSNPARSRMVR
jgi:peptidyl-dipeptidase Dcp